MTSRRPRAGSGRGAAAPGAVPARDTPPVLRVPAAHKGGAPLSLPPRRFRDELRTPSHRTGLRPDPLHLPRRTCMKPTLASALAIGCVSAALVSTTSTSQAAPGAPADRSAATVAAARANAQDHAGIGTGQGLVVKDTVLDANGGSHVRFDRTYRGLPVVGGDLVVHQARGNAFRSVSGRAVALRMGVRPACRPERRRQGRRHRRLREVAGHARAGRPGHLRHARPGLARRRHRPPRRRLARRRVRLRQRPEGRSPRPVALRAGGGRHRHRRMSSAPSR